MVSGDGRPLVRENLAEKVQLTRIRTPLYELTNDEPKKNSEVAVFRSKFEQ